MIRLHDAVRAVEEVLRNKGNQVTKVTGRTDLRELGLDSLDLAEILVILESRDGAELNPNSVNPLEHVSDLTRLMPR